MLFNKSSNGASELKDILGFIDRSIDFEEINPFITEKTRELKKLIESSMFEIVEDHYNSSDYDTAGDFEKLDELVKLCQNYIARYAYHSFAPVKDLSHGSNGRKLRVTDGEKIPSDRLLNRDSEAILKLAHDAADTLLVFMDEQVVTPVEVDPEAEPNPIPDIGITWSQSKKYALRKELFVANLDEFEKIFPINNSCRLFYVLLPFITESQKRFLKPCMTSEKYNEIVLQLKNKTLTAANQEIIDYAAPPIVFRTMKTAVKRLSVQILPLGIFRNAATDQSLDFDKTPADATFYNKIITVLSQQEDDSLSSFIAYMDKLAKIESGVTPTVEGFTLADPENKFATFF